MGECTFIVDLPNTFIFTFVRFFRFIYFFSIEQNTLTPTHDRRTHQHEAPWALALEGGHFSLTMRTPRFVQAPRNLHSTTFVPKLKIQFWCKRKEQFTYLKSIYPHVNWRKGDSALGNRSTSQQNDRWSISGNSMFDGLFELICHVGSLYKNVAPFQILSTSTTFYLLSIISGHFERFDLLKTANMTNQLK
jgi:hypothetical protein